MTNHTPEPYGPYVHGETRHDRIIACVNACAGIPTDRLEDGDFLELVDAVAHYMDPKSDHETAWDDMKAALGPFRACAGIPTEQLVRGYVAAVMATALRRIIAAADAILTGEEPPTQALQEIQMMALSALRREDMDWPWVEKTSLPLED